MIRASEVENAEPTGDAPIDIQPTLVNWPSDAPVRLAAAAECAEVPTNRFAWTFEDANQLTRFVDDGVAFALAVTPLVPGRSCSSRAILAARLATVRVFVITWSHVVDRHCRERHE